ncbi:glycosyltransferase, group 1 family protein [Leptospira ryugenii]|uniref:Glycosyltransferase, group 1 family protein n=1 Tax=Leptospira ryugenii TaxID=1917863 RepID=A0A2P2E3B9_9LEPT|nr:glycosyltransferase family 1 protein [Leptospira ryugenii]GBF51361.1 glycosyltransferase, group 1 family protein [Leptospira ryugenii]
MLKVGFDARMIENSGIGIRIQHILKFWPLSKEDVQLFIFGNEKVLKNYSIPNDAKVISYDPPIYSIRESFGHPMMKDMDLLEIPHFNVPLLYVTKCLVTIHDLIPYHFKVAHSSLVKRLYLKIILHSVRLFSKHVISVSEYTKQDLIRTFHFKPSKVTVIYNGIDLKQFKLTSSQNLNEFKEKYKLPEIYFLSVGIPKVHKNFEFLLRSLNAMWKDRLTDIPLVIAGMKGKIPDEWKAIVEEHPHRYFFFPQIAYEDLAKLYQGAKLFLYPTLLEGFGFPALEAQAVGTPVLCSNSSVLPEILKQSAVYFSPTNEEEFKKAVLLLLEDSKTLEKLSQLGLENAKSFTWDRAIRKLESLYQSNFLAD